MLTVLAALLAPMLMSGTAQAAELCLPTPETGCIAGTLKTEVGPLEGVDISVSGPGFDETTTTDADGKWNVEIAEAGKYDVSIVEETLPSDLAPVTTKVTVQAAPSKTQAALLNVRTADYSSTTSFGEYVLQSSVNGLRLGLLLALASIGLSLIYGTTGLSNFAHAEMVTLGGMVGYGLINVLGVNLWLGGVLVFVIMGAFGTAQDLAIWQPLRRRGLGLTQMMIVTIGLSLTLQYSVQYLVGSKTKRVIQDNPDVVSFGSVTITIQSLVAMAIAAVLILLVAYALLRTRIGRATRAVADNPALASASGIDVDRVIRLVWTVAGAMAGLSGLLYALVTNGIKWDSGMQILLLLFAAVTLGGLGTAFGALVGSMIIGLVVELAPVFGMPGDFKYATALLILILLLLVRPQGLLGRAERVG